MSREWRVTIPGRAPTANALRRLMPLRRAAEAKKWRRWAYYTALGQGVPALGQARVRMTRYGPQTTDVDALAGGAGKHLLDGLVDAGIVADDDAAHVAVIYESRRCAPGEARVELVISEWTEGEDDGRG